MKLPEMLPHLLLGEYRGIYIPQAFYEGFDFKTWTGLNISEYPELSTPENAGYWDAWSEVLDRAKLMEEYDGTGWIVEWFLYQDGDLWAVLAGNRA